MASPYESSDDRISLIGNSNSHVAEKDQNKKATKSILSFSNLPFLYFCIGGLVSIGCVVLYLMDNDTGFIVSGLIGIIISMYGLKHFHTLLGLKKEVDEFFHLNKQFKSEHKSIKKDVDRLSVANNELKATHTRLQDANAKNKENLIQFRRAQHNMSQFNAESIDELNVLIQKSQILEKKWKEEVFSHERDLLHRVFDRFASGTSHIGMTKEEFDKFSVQLPNVYQDRFGRMGTFNKLSEGKSVILLEDFAQTLDLFAEMQTDDVDIEFEFKPTKRPRKQDLYQMKSMRTTRSMMAEKSVLKYIHEDIADDEKIASDEELEFEDDRDYDQELILYDRQIVITRRTDTKLNIGLSQMSFSQSIMSDNGTPSTPDLHRKSHPFGTNLIIRDAPKMNNINESITLSQFDDDDDINNAFFNDEQMNSYMNKMNVKKDVDYAFSTRKLVESDSDE